MPGGQFLAHDQAPGQAQQQQDGAGAEHPHQRRDRPFQARLAQGDPVQVQGALPVAPGFQRGGVETLDHRQHRQVLFGRGRLLGPGLHGRMAQRPQPPAHQLEQDEQQRHQDRDRHRDRRRHAQHHRQRADQGEQQRQQRHQGAGEVAAQAVDVAGQQRQHVAAAALLVPGQGQGLQVRVQLRPGIGHQPARDRLQLHRHRVAQRRLRGHQHEQQPKQVAEALAEHQPRGQQASGPGLGQGGHALHQHQRQRQQQGRQVRAQQGQQPGPWRGQGRPGLCIPAAGIGGAAALVPFTRHPRLPTLCVRPLDLCP